jgi:hypothetical protein
MATAGDWEILKKKGEKVKKVIFIILAVVLMLALPTAVLAAKPEQGLKGLKGQAGRSNVAFVELWEKDPSTWDIVEDGAWGKLKYNLEGATFDFVFNGHGLEIGTNYTLIYYADPWPGNNPGASIAKGTANDEGDIHLAGSLDPGMDLPDSSDGNYPDGAKVWLVLSDDYDETTCQMTGWNPTEYLFEYDLINYDDTDV